MNNLTTPITPVGSKKLSPLKGIFMIKFFSATMIAFFAVAAFAGEPVLVKPTGVPGFRGRPDLKPIAQVTEIMRYEQSGGLFANFASKTISVKSDGTVLFTMHRYGAAESTELLATLAPATLSNLKEKIEALSSNIPLIDENPDMPPMLDGPSSSMAIVKTDGTEKVIQTYTQGHTSALEYGQGLSLVEILEGFKSLAN